MFQNISYEQIRKNMLERVSDNSDNLNRLDKREGSLISDAISPAALEIMGVYIALERIISEAYGDTASREFLILRCKERGIEPFPATCAVYKGEFSPSTVDVSGKRFSVGEVNFTVGEKIADGQYYLTCETAGAEGNRHFGTAIPIDYIEGLETAEVTSLLIPGEDEEDTEALRQRYFSSFNIRAFGGNKADYIEKISAMAGVGGVKITRVWNSGVKPSELVPSESVLTWYDENSATLPEDVSAWLTPTITAAKSGKLTSGGCVLATLLDSEFSPATQALTEQVKQALDPSDSTGEGDGIVPIGHVVTVQSAVPVTVNISTDITFAEGYSWDILQTAIEKVVEDYLLELRKSWQNTSSLIVRISQIETRILGISGVVDIGVTTINGEPSNLILGEFEIPVIGEVKGVSANG